MTVPLDAALRIALGSNLRRGMAGYFGTPEQQRLQARADETAVWAAATPGACNSGRFIGCDDIDLMGWPLIHEILLRDGAMAS